MNLNVLYGQETATVKDVEIDGKSFRIIKLPAFDAMKLSHKLAKVGMPLVSVFLNSKKDEEVDFSKIDFDDDALSELIKKVVEMCQTENRMVMFNNDMTSLKMPYLLALEFVKFNFSDFFLNSPILKEAVEKVDGLNLRKMMSKE